MERPKNVELTLFGFFPNSSAQFKTDAMAEVLRKAYPDWTVNSPTIMGPVATISKRLADDYDFFNMTHPWPLDVAAFGPNFPDIDFEKEAAHCVVLPIGEGRWHMFIPDSLPYKNLSELIQDEPALKWGLGSGPPPIVTFTRLMEVYGVKVWDDLLDWGGTWVKKGTVGGSDGPDNMRSGLWDFGVTPSSAPAVPWQGVTNARLLPVDRPEAIEALEDLGWFKATIPADAYAFLDEDLPTMGDIQYSACNPKLPEDVIYYVVKALWENQDQLKAAHVHFVEILEPDNLAQYLKAVEETGVPIHPGAERFFREIGILK